MAFQSEMSSGLAGAASGCSSESQEDEPRLPSVHGHLPGAYADDVRRQLPSDLLPTVRRRPQRVPDVPGEVAAVFEKETGGLGEVQRADVQMLPGLGGLGLVLQAKHTQGM